MATDLGWVGKSPSCNQQYPRNDSHGCRFSAFGGSLWRAKHSDFGHSFLVLNLEVVLRRLGLDLSVEAGRSRWLLISPNYS